jgi:hypothetical protein
MVTCGGFSGRRAAAFQQIPKDDPGAGRGSVATPWVWTTRFTNELIVPRLHFIHGPAT